ncbi:thioredoxin domain-containing protein [Salinimonas sp. HHU 13199]|uniref:Thioredoxin domain-containing protein n=1 Tax=Salinimonas profundi TaxID=2729140 RepID=A0ABR8LDC2_9ALTE|nr:thioredoxin domain-containing protein [Salinimonas profundi]MBD3584309.1 thioredoxin domain-containing protein [Salinimonas profundi]
MLTHPTKLTLLLFALLMVCGKANAQTSNDGNLEEELSGLRQEVSALKEQLATIASQVQDIHNIAIESQRPNYRTVSTQKDFAGNGNLAQLGDTTAQLAIVEFSDYQCPYCKHFVDTTFSRLKNDFIDKGKVIYITRDFPLSFHKKAKGAAVAANCSLQQDAYWPMRKQLFSNMKKLGEELYRTSAQQLSLDMTKFSECLEDQSVLAKVEQDIEYGTSLGIRGTPSFLIGKVEGNDLVTPKLLVGAQSYETLAALLNELASAPAQEAGE